MVYSSAQALLVIINDILDFSRLDAGKMILAPAPSRSAPDRAGSDGAV